MILPAFPIPKRLTFLILFVFYNLSSYSQNWKEAFQIPAPDSTITGSHYKHIELVDVREDSSNMGFVRVGLNEQAWVIFKNPLQQQLASAIADLTDSSAFNDTLFFQLRHLSFSEQAVSSSQASVFRFRANVYRKVNDKYIPVNSIDTVIRLRSGGEAGKSFLKKTGVDFIHFLAHSLKMDGDMENSCTRAELENPDSTEKSKIKLYTTTQYTDGLYLTYKSFAAQTPDKPVFAEEKDNKLKNVQTYDSSGSLMKLKSKDAYAIVYKGKLYAATSYSFFPITKEIDDFYFTGKVKPGVDPMAYVAFGLTGLLLSSFNYNSFDMRIDHLTGEFLHIRYIPVPE